MTWLAIPFAVAWAARLFGVRHVLRAPRFYGSDWCCDCRVTPGFYENEGRGLMRSLQARVLIPLAPEAVIAVLLWSQGRWLTAFAVEGAVTAAAYLYHLVLLRGVARRAWRYAIPVPDPVSSLAVSLRQRTAADYTQPWLEWTLRGTAGATLMLLGVAFARPSWHENVARLAGIPGIVFYGVLGLTLAKHAAASWRVFGAPAVNPEQFMEVQDAVRRHLVLICDYLMALVLTALLCWAILQVIFIPWAARLYVRVGPAGAVALAGLMPLIQSERRVTTLGRKLRAPLEHYRPISPPPESVSWAAGRLCFRRGEPAMFVRGGHGLALNAGSARTWVWLAYGSGCIVIGMAIAAWK